MELSEEVHGAIEDQVPTIQHHLGTSRVFRSFLWAVVFFGGFWGPFCLGASDEIESQRFVRQATIEKGTKG